MESTYETLAEAKKEAQHQANLNAAPRDVGYDPELERYFVRRPKDMEGLVQVDRVYPKMGSKFEV